MSKRPLHNQITRFINSTIKQKLVGKRFGPFQGRIGAHLTFNETNGPFLVEDISFEFTKIYEDAGMDPDPFRDAYYHNGYELYLKGTNTVTGEKFYKKFDLEDLP